MKYSGFFAALFAVMFFLSSCEKDMSYESGDAGGVLVKDSLGDCQPITINGTVHVGTALNSGNSADVQVAFTKAGAYNLRTDTVNGYSFVASGSGEPGIATIHLVGSGTPITLGSGVDAFHVSFGGSVCEFDVVVNGGGGIPPVVGTIAATINGLAVTFNQSDTATFLISGGLPTLECSAQNAAGQIIQIGIALSSGASVPAGSYDVSALSTYAIAANYIDAASLNYTAQTGATNPTPSFIAVLNNSVSGPSGTVSGTFSGTVKDSGGTTITLTGGSFTLNVGAP